MTPKIARPTRRGPRALLRSDALGAQVTCMRAVRGVTWGMDSSRTDKPLLLAGPHDPTNNVAGTVKDWKEVSKYAEKTLELLDKIGVVNNWSASSTVD